MSQQSKRPDNEIGPAIRAMRLERGMTLDQLSSAAGISASHLSRLERGQAEPSFTVASALAKAIGVSLSELVNQPS